MLMNPKDPLHNNPEAERVLFNALIQACNGFSHDQVAGAAVNVLINVLRQSNATREAAMSGADRLHATMRQVLDAHYDAMGRRRNVFPFHQVIEVPRLDLR